MTINISQVILDIDVKTELTLTYDVIPTSGRNLEYKPISEQQRFLGNSSMHCSTSCILTVVPLVEMTAHLKFSLCFINSNFEKLLNHFEDLPDKNESQEPESNIQTNNVIQNLSGKLINNIKLASIF